MMEAALAVSMLLPPPSPITKSQPLSLASAAAAMTPVRVGLGVTLSNTATDTPFCPSSSITRCWMPSFSISLSSVTHRRAFLPGRERVASSFRRPAPKTIRVGMK